MKTKFIVLSLSALVMTQLGCSSIPKNVQAPDVAVQSLDVDKATLTDATVIVKLAVRNPNSFGLKMDSIKYGLNLEGKPFASGTLNDSASVDANGETEISVPLRIRYWDLYSRFSDLVKNKGANYNIVGSITTHGHEFPFKHDGEVKLPET
ncbi:MAG: LEA type 2 family protein [Bdellovibrionia bacterium]